MRPKRTDDKYWTETGNYNHIQYESDLVDYIIDLENETHKLRERAVSGHHNRIALPTEECVKQWYAEGYDKDKNYWRHGSYRTNTEAVHEIMMALKYFMITWQGSGDTDKLAREIAEMPDEQFLENCKAIEEMAQHKPNGELT